MAVCQANREFGTPCCRALPCPVHTGLVKPQKPGEPTPGPWRIGDAGKTVFGPPNGQPSPATVARVTHKANARLVAAAPQMREALAALLAWVDENVDAICVQAIGDARRILKELE